MAIPIAIDRHAVDELRFIRATMERAVQFTAVPGVGMALMGMIAGAAYITSLLSPVHWLNIWLIAAVVAFTTGISAMARKARRGGLSLWSRPAQSFARTFIPPIVLGAFLTGALVKTGAVQLLPGVWLSLYGLAALAGGTFSVRSVAIMGILFLLFGAAALLYTSTGSILMLCGFGILHIAFGIYISLRHGG